MTMGKAKVMKKYIINTLYDIKLKPPLISFKLGNFTICNYMHFQLVFPDIKPIPGIDPELSVMPNESQPGKYELIYETDQNINTKSFENLFSDHINMFINILVYISGNRAYYINEYGPFYKDKEYKNLYFGGEEIGFAFRSTSSNECTKTCELDDKIFNKKGNNKRLFDYIENEPLTEIERKIKLAVSWIGQSLCNRHLDEAYLGLCIALETLLSGQNSPMERGTAYQLREFGAFLAEHDKEKRLSMYNDLKDLYNIRCEISHSGRAKKLTMVEYNKLLKILKSIIGELFVLLETKNITTHKKLQNHINELKFE